MDTACLFKGFDSKLEVSLFGEAMWWSEICYSEYAKYNYNYKLLIA